LRLERKFPVRAQLYHCRSSARRGFTLIEILCVVIILGIVSAMILPQISTRDDSKVASAARSMMADLIYAQNRAITMQKTHYVVFDAANNKYSVVTSVSPMTIITHPVTQNAYTVVFGKSPLENVTMSSISFDGQTTLAFDALGVPNSYTAGVGLQPLNSGSVVIAAPNASMTVSVLPYSGEVKVQ
jgi:prepilin-type N-terminal cleavage/methylation domain-containing protein